MAWDDTFVYKVSKVTSAQMNAIIAKIKSILAEDIIFSDSTTGDVSSSMHGYFPKIPGGSGFWRADGVWAATGAGDITGTTGTTDNAILLADGTGGATFQGSGVTIDGSDNIVTTGTIGGGVITGTSLVASTGGVNIPTGQTYKINNTALAYTNITGAGNVSTGVTLTDSALVLGAGTSAVKIGTDLPTATTIGSAYVYRAGGTDVPYTDGGTGISTFPKRTIFLSCAGGWTSTTDGAGTPATTETANGGEFRGISFAADATKYYNWGHIMPLNYDGGTVTATPVFLPVTSDASNHTIIFSLQGASFTSADPKNVAFGTAIDSSYTVAADQSAAIIMGTTTTAITIGGANQAAGGDFVLWRCHRDTADTYTGAVVLLGWKIVYQTNGTSDE